MGSLKASKRDGRWRRDCSGDGLQLPVAPWQAHSSGPLPAPLPAGPPPSPLPSSWRREILARAPHTMDWLAGGGGRGWQPLPGSSTGLGALEPFVWGQRSGGQRRSSEGMVPGWPELSWPQLYTIPGVLHHIQHEGLGSDRASELPGGAG